MQIDCYYCKVSHMLVVSSCSRWFSCASHSRHSRSPIPSILTQPKKMTGHHLAAFATAAFATISSAFAPPNPSLSFTPRFGNPQSNTSPRLSSASDGLEDMDDERRSAQFQTLLRDLQIEGVPLLGCDADQVSTLNAAIWTTMAELGDADNEQRACLVMEKIPTTALLAFAEDFTVLKTQDRLMDFLPELKRYSISVLGKGLGPALLIETEKRTVVEQLSLQYTFDKDKTIGALKSFVNR